MDEPLAVALKFGFLAVLYLFLIWVARSAMKDLSRGGEAAAAGPVEPPGPRRRGSSVPEPRAGVAPQLVVVAAKGYEPGVSWDIGRGAMMGRSDGAEIRVEDAFASSAHARIFLRGDLMYVEDMGSTNGTYLNGRQIKAPERLKMADVIRIGDSEYRYQE
jgi:pSer/pThr/pTyr-binding forkhead associated (FHA) protein